jgi:adenylate cyclase
MEFKANRFMDINLAEKILAQIKSFKLKNLSDKLIRTAIRYAQIRVEWLIVPVKERMELEEERTLVHNAFISSCDILARNMGKQGEHNSWRKLI